MFLMGGWHLDDRSTRQQLLQAQAWCSSKCWMAELIKKLWNVTWDMWAHRNGILQNSAQAQLMILESDINQTITNIYAIGPQYLLREALHFLWTPLRKPFNYHSVDYKQQWIESVELAHQKKALKWHVPGGVMIYGVLGNLEIRKNVHIYMKQNGITLWLLATLTAVKQGVMA